MAKKDNVSTWRPFDISNPARSVECKGFDGRVVHLALRGEGRPVSLQNRDVCPELATDAIAEQFEATDEARQLRASQQQLAQCKEDRAAVEDSLHELRGNLTREGAAADLRALRSQQRVCADIEADLTIASAQAWDAAQRRLSAIESDTRQAIFVEATREKNKAVSEIGPAIAEILERLTAADARQKRASRSSQSTGHYGSGADQRAYMQSSYDGLLGQRPNDRKAKDAVGDFIATA